MGELIAVELTPEERGVLVRGLGEWGGPSSATDEVARVIGFDDLEALHAGRKRIALRLEAEEGLSRLDWARALIATELVFASDYYGAGVDWSIVTGLGDEVTVHVLRQLQRKLVSIANLA